MNIYRSLLQAGFLQELTMASLNPSVVSESLLQVCISNENQGIY